MITSTLFRSVIERTVGVAVFILIYCCDIIGGLGFSTSQIGTALLCVAAPLLFLQIWTYPKVQILKRQ